MSEKTTTDKIIEAVIDNADYESQSTITIRIESLRTAVIRAIREQDKIDLNEVERLLDLYTNDFDKMDKKKAQIFWRSKIHYTLADLTQKTKEDGK